MDPSNKSTPGFESSTPVFTENPQGELVPAAAEQAPAAPERAPVPAAPPAAGPPLSAIPLPGSAPTAPPAAAGSVTPALPTTPVIDDDDRVEKVWVEKAKQIVEHTRDDPHKQSQELTVFKADYMKKRYGKSIKITQ